jgi:hypothetical protein
MVIMQLIVACAGDSRRCWYANAIFSLSLVRRPEFAVRLATSRRQVWTAPTDRPW